MLFEKRKRGFTLVEMLIVMVIIAILAAIILPRIIQARRRANEANARETLQELRNAAKEFEVDLGYYPTALADVVATTCPASGLKLEGTSIVTEAIPSGIQSQFRGPYLTATALPSNVLTGAVDWSYNTTDHYLLGEVTMGISGSDTTGTPYSEW